MKTLALLANDVEQMSLSKPIGTVEVHRVRTTGLAPFRVICQAHGIVKDSSIGVSRHKCLKGEWIAMGWRSVASE